LGFDNSSFLIKRNALYVHEALGLDNEETKARQNNSWMDPEHLAKELEARLSFV
jgi:hypothetical protein